MWCTSTGACFTGRQQRAYPIVRVHKAFTVSRLNRRNAPTRDALCPSPPFATGGWAWVYITAANIRQGAKKSTDATVLTTKLSLNWIGLFKILAMGPTPAPDTPDGRLRHDKRFYLDLPSELPRRDSKYRGLVVRYKPRRNRDDTDDTINHHPTGLSTYVLDSSPTESPPYHIALDDVSPPPERLEVETDFGIPTRSRP